MNLRENQAKGTFSISDSEIQSLRYSKRTALEALVELVELIGYGSATSKIIELAGQNLV